MIYARFKTDLARAETIREFYHAQEIQDEKKPYEDFFVKKNATSSGIKWHFCLLSLKLVALTCKL